MKLIQNNPFRAVGILANTTGKKIWDIIDVIVGVELSLTLIKTK
ncbi:MAG: hypothetical protein AB8G86_20675 [Saprospiraceae bacterium]